MNDIEKTFLWKINVRKNAINNMNGIDDKEVISNETSQSIHKLTEESFYLLIENLKVAQDNYIQSEYHTIQSNRKIIGPMLVFSKKCIRKITKIFMGWYISPILEQQTCFNGRVVNALCHLKDISLRYEEAIKKQEEIISQQEKTIKEQELILTSLEETVINLGETLTKQEEALVDQETTFVKHEKNMEYVFDRLGVTCDLKLLGNHRIDYFDFENKFRGSRDNVKASQRNYLDYFRQNSGQVILDIGCGRGEFLELMQDAAIPAMGVDSYHPFVEYCTNRGFRAVESDALTYLSQVENNSLGGIFMAHVVEHLSNDYLLALINVAYSKLIAGCYFILETPNPDCLAAISEFNIDISHVKPVHYKSLEYLFKAADYQSVERYHTPQSMYPYNLHHIEGSGVNNVDEFNQGVDRANQLIFGFRDYSLIARK